jgi:hypothetical protein
MGSGVGRSEARRVARGAESAIITTKAGTIRQTANNAPANKPRGQNGAVMLSFMAADLTPRARTGCNYSPDEAGFSEI